MKIAYISTFLPQQCGIATYTNYLVNAHHRINNDLKIRIVAENKALPYTNTFLEVMPIWSRKNDYSKPIIKYTQGYNIIHIQHEYGIFQNNNHLIKTIIGMDKKAKKVVTIHCVRPEHFSDLGNIENNTKRFARLFDLIIVHLPCQKAVLKRLGIEPNKIKIIAHGTEINDINQTQARQKLNLPLSAKILLMFGFIKAHKCADIVLDALPEIIKNIPDIYFYLAGGLAPNPNLSDIKYLKSLKRKIKKLNLSQNVIFPNCFFANEDVPYLISAADIVLFPYYEQDFSASGSLHLSIGAKKPVIATRIPKFEELKNISDELIILPNSPQLISKLILRLLLDNDFLKYIIKRTDKYRKQTAWNKIAKQHFKLYNELIT